MYVNNIITGQDDLQNRTFVNVFCWWFLLWGICYLVMISENVYVYTKRAVNLIFGS